jgi:hypothetical protein
MIVDQMTLEFMQSKAPPPIQASLDAMLAGATRRRIVKAGMAGDKAMEGPVLLDTRSPEHLAGPRKHLVIVEDSKRFGHVMDLWSKQRRKLDLHLV